MHADTVKRPRERERERERETGGGQGSQNSNYLSLMDKIGLLTSRCTRKKSVQSKFEGSSLELCQLTLTESWR